VTADAPAEATPVVLDQATLDAAEKVVRDRAKRSHYASDARRLLLAADEIRALGEVA
jgi:hypothetical protein